MYTVLCRQSLSSLQCVRIHIGGGRGLTDFFFFFLLEQPFLLWDSCKDLNTLLCFMRGLKTACL